MKQLCILITCIILLNSGVTAQVAISIDLFETLRNKDSLLFQIGFNQCDLEQIKSLLCDDFEFYHDQAGITSSKAEFIQSVRENVCSLDYAPRRVIDPHSIDVYPLKNDETLYGAIQMGTHRFYATEDGKHERLTSFAQFTHVWLIENGSWKLSRVLSYDHQERNDSDVIDTSILFKDREETEKWMTKLNLANLGVGYIENGVIKEVSVYGDLSNGHPAPANTIFNVASLTKPVTTMVALKMVEAGQWNLDEPVYTYWVDPDVEADPRSKTLTTRHILSHRTGFPNWRFNSPNAKLTFESDPGTEFQYSGEGFEYLRKALENKFDKSLDQLASELIFQPLAMGDTRFYWDEKMDDSPFATWHKADGTLYPTYRNDSANAADDLLTTLEDYCKFMIHVMNGAGLSKELYDEMISKQSQVKPHKHVGLGWMVHTEVGDGELVINHGGDDKGVHTMAFMLPASREGLLIFTNSDNGTDAYIPVILHYLGDRGQDIIDIETN